ncbi:hypothetical protein C8Q80DRAFT_739617 [Daedaleopsis nitida]|nr:hypothetical protein C8Q80DRAFT_739617 [Daedaleopsis nitida]
MVCTLRSARVSPFNNPHGQHFHRNCPDTPHLGGNTTLTSHNHNLAPTIPSPAPQPHASPSPSGSPTPFLRFPGQPDSNFALTRFRGRYHSPVSLSFSLLALVSKHGKCGTSCPNLTPSAQRVHLPGFPLPVYYLAHQGTHGSVRVPPPMFAHNKLEGAPEPSSYFCSPPRPRPRSRTSRLLFIRFALSRGPKSPSTRVFLAAQVSRLHTSPVSVPYVHEYPRASSILTPASQSTLTGSRVCVIPVRALTIYSEPVRSGVLKDTRIALVTLSPPGGGGASHVCMCAFFISVRHLSSSPVVTTASSVPRRQRTVQLRPWVRRCHRTMRSGAAVPLLAYVRCLRP